MRPACTAGYCVLQAGAAPSRGEKGGKDPPSRPAKPDTVTSFMDGVARASLPLIQRPDTIIMSRPRGRGRARKRRKRMC